MNETKVRTKQSIAALTITVCIGLLWIVMPHPILIVALCFAPLALLFVLNQTFWLVTLFVIFSFFRIHEAFPVIYNLENPITVIIGGTRRTRFSPSYKPPDYSFLAPFIKVAVYILGSGDHRNHIRFQS